MRGPWEIVRDKYLAPEPDTDDDEASTTKPPSKEADSLPPADKDKHLAPELVANDADSTPEPPSEESDILPAEPLIGRKWRGALTVTAALGAGALAYSGLHDCSRAIAEGSASDAAQGIGDIAAACIIGWQIAANYINNPEREVWHTLSPVPAPNAK